MLKIVLILLLQAQILCHSNMSFPPNRGNLKWWGYCSRGNGCMGACEAPKAESKIGKPIDPKLTYKRGDKIEVKWSRQNHPGGFVRLSITQFDRSDEATAFDDGVIQYSCFESNCKETTHIDMFGDGNGSGELPCTTELIVPDYLEDGTYTMQWTWFGGGIFQGDIKGSFAEYVSCADFYVKDGPKKAKENKKPSFKGGDPNHPANDQCRYWSSNKVHFCPIGAETKDKSSCGYGPIRNGLPEGVDVDIVSTTVNKVRENVPLNINKKN